MKYLNLMRKYKASIPLVALYFAPFVFADAPTYDVSSVTAAIGGANTAIGTVGLAVIGIFVAIKAYKWIRRSL